MNIIHDSELAHRLRESSYKGHYWNNWQDLYSDREIV